jgi:hypothetical protein
MHTNPLFEKYERALLQCLQVLGIQNGNDDGMDLTLSKRLLMIGHDLDHESLHEITSCLNIVIQSKLSGPMESILPHTMFRQILETLERTPEDSST